MKSLVYKEMANTREELWQRIVDAAQNLRNEQLFFKIRRSFSKRTLKCIEVNGTHFEQFLSKADLFLLNLLTMAAKAYLSIYLIGLVAFYS